MPGGDTQGSGIGAGVHDRLRQPRHGIDCVVEGLIERSIRFEQELEAQRRSLDQACVCLTENTHPAPITAAGARLAQNALASGGVVERGKPAVVPDPGDDVRAAGRPGRLEKGNGSVARTHRGQAPGPRQDERARLAPARRRLCRRGEQRQRQPPHGKRWRRDRQARQQRFDPRSTRARPDIGGERLDPRQKHAGRVRVDGIERADLDAALGRPGGGQRGCFVLPYLDGWRSIRSCGVGLVRLRGVVAGFVRLHGYQAQRLIGLLSDALTYGGKQQQSYRNDDADGCGSRASADRRTGKRRSQHWATRRRFHFSKRSLDRTFSIEPLGGGMSQVRRNPIPPPMMSKRMTTRTFKRTCLHS